MTTLAWPPIAAQTEVIMDTSSRLRDLTAEEYSLQQRQAGMLLAVLREHGAVATDPQMLEMFFAGRQVTAPVRMAVKSAIAAMDTASGLAPTAAMIGAFVGAVDRRWTLGQLGAIRVPSANVVGATQTANATAHWVGEGSAKPLSALAFAALALAARKLVADVPVTAELLKLGTADALQLVERATVSAVASAADTALFDPTNAGIADVKPASLTNGLVAIVASGDFQNQIGQAFAAISGGAPTRPVLVVSLQTALRLTGLRDLEAAGIKVVVTPAAANHLIAIDADGIAYSDDGGALRIGAPTIEMSDTPATPTVAGTVLVSAWQRNLKVIRGERWVNWAKRSDAVSFLTLA